MLKLSHILAVTALCLSSALFAQAPDAQPAAQVFNEDVLSQLLGTEHRDEINGFSLRLPAEVRTIHGANPDELVTFVQSEKQWGGSVARMILKKEMTPADLLQANAAEISRVFRAVQIQDSREMMIAGKPAGRLLSIMQAADGKDAVMLARHTLLVQINPKLYLNITMFSPAKSAAESLRTFDAMVSTLKILDPKQIEAERLKAIENGKQWLLMRSAEEAATKLLKNKQVFRIRVAGADVGYMEIEEREGTYLVYKGIEQVISTRTFPDERTLNASDIAIFWAFRKQPQMRQTVELTMWRQGTKTTIRTPRGDSIGWVQEQGTMQMDPMGKWQIAVTRTGDQPLGGDQGYNKPLTWEITPDFPMPMHKGLEFLWPRLIDLTKPTQLGGVVFNSTLSRLGLRKLRVVGPDTITVDGKKMDAIRLDDEIESITTMLWVDATGKLLMMRTLDGTMATPTTEDEMNQRWGARLKALATPAPTPAPAMQTDKNKQTPNKPATR